MLYNEFRDLYQQLLTDQKKERNALLEKYAREKKFLQYDRMDCIQENGTKNIFLITGWEISEGFAISSVVCSGFYYGHDVDEHGVFDQSRTKKLSFDIVAKRFSKVETMENLNMGSIYLLNTENTNFYKIGFAFDVEERVSDLQAGSPFKILIVASKKNISPRELEKRMHFEYRDRRTRREWFEFTEEEVNNIKALFFT